MYQWLTTAPNPRAPAAGYDAGQRGWRLHAVKAQPDDTLQGVGRQAASCGLVPAHGWDLDLFINQPCEKCVRRVGGWTRVAGFTWRQTKPAT